MRRFDRRGMSPLIATVLLMAFAVALGGMIMNWTATPQKSVDCSGITLTKIQFCTDGSGVNIRVRNTGNEPIASLDLQVENPAGSPYAILLQDSSLGKGESKQMRVPLPIPEGSNVGLIPTLSSDDSSKCPTPVMSQSLEKC